ncbi:hypothetical protein CRYUN_Cryun08bG0058500 [Craigia yunnanensis]
MATSASSNFNDMNSRTVCVMDASGHLGSILVHLLLQRGYSVHAAVQHHGYSVQIPFDYHSITNALKGCRGLFYCFEPPSDHSTYDKHVGCLVREFMAEVEVRAAHNVLEACAQTDTMEKVVFTSSVTAVIWNEGRNTASFDLDERNWSDINFCKKFKLWHALSKTLAEKSAWALAIDRGINMVTINGGLLMTPDLTITNPYLKGAAEMYEDGVFVTVDLRFIADAHICVFEDISCYGRYLCFNHVINCSHDADKLAQMLLPSSDTSPPQSSEAIRIYQQRISNKKLNNMMMEFENDQLLTN